MLKIIEDVIVSAGYPINRRVASRDYIGQGPILWSLPSNPSMVDGINVTRPYGRFGNNLIQAVNALIIAKQLGIKRMQLCQFTAATKCSLMIEGLELRPDLVGQIIEGTFYAPYGFESLFSDMDIKKVAFWQKALSDGLYGHLFPLPPHREEVLALHFRSGDIFSTTQAVSPSYVQPPFAYYKMAIEDAIARQDFARIDLVYEDRANPAIELTESYLSSCGLKFHSMSSTIEADIMRMLSATVIVASVSTFSEASALISSRLRRYYSFREHSSQSEFAPFFQAKTAAVLKSRGVECCLVDDMSKCYTAKWQWSNSEQQRDFIRCYDSEGLRLYFD